MSGGMPHTPSGGGCMTPPMSPCPSVRMSMNALRSRLSDAPPFDNQIAGNVGRNHLADGLRRLFLDVVHLRDRDPEIDVVLSGDEREEPRRYVFDDRVFDAVKIRPVLFPII